MIVGRVTKGKFVTAKKSTKAQQASFRAMLSSHTPPRGQTDSSFFAGMGLAKQFGGSKLGDRELERITGLAMKQGFKPSNDSIYMDTLAVKDGEDSRSFSQNIIFS